MSKTVVIVGAFDNLRSREVRFIEEASKSGEVTALVYCDSTIEKQLGIAPKFPLAERLYLLGALRFVKGALALDASGSPNALRSAAAGSRRCCAGARARTRRRSTR